MDTNTNYQQYSGDISPYLGKNFNYGQLTQLNSAMGAPAGNQPTFISGGNIYQVKDNGNNTFSLNQIDTVGNRQNEQTQQKEGQFTTDLTKTINSLPSPTDTYKTLADTLGITGTQTALTNAENNLNLIPTTTQNLATSMGGISADQMRERNATKSAELSPVVSSLANELGIKNQQFGTLFQGQEQQNENKLLPFQYQAQFLGQNAQNSFNLMSQEQQQQFQTVFSQLQTQEQIDEATATKAIDLANQLKLYGQYPSLTGSSILNPAILQALGGTLGTGGNTGSGTGSGYTFG